MFNLLPRCYGCGKKTATYRTTSKHYMSTCDDCIEVLENCIRDRDKFTEAPARLIVWEPITFAMYVSYVISRFVEMTKIEIGGTFWSGLIAHRIRGKEWSKG